MFEQGFRIIIFILKNNIKYILKLYIPHMCIAYFKYYIHVICVTLMLQTAYKSHCYKVLIFIYFFSKYMSH